MITTSGSTSSQIATIRFNTSVSQTVCHAAHGNTAKEPGANFPAAYRCNKLIYDEYYSNVQEVIARESELKKWSRAKKIELINRLNPSWLDLSAELLQDR